MTRPAPPPFSILFEDAHLIAVAKPAGWLTQADASGEPSALDAVRNYLRANAGGSDVFLGLVHRLDRNVGGVLVFAKTPQAATHLSRQFSRNRVRKFYRCRVEGCPPPPAGKLVHHLRKEKSLKATVFPRQAPGAKRAELSYRVLENSETESLLEVELHTGRFHQIRAQLAFIGHPVAGDAKYRAKTRRPGYGLALWAVRLELRHPQTGRDLTLLAPPPEGAGLEVSVPKTGTPDSQAS